MAARQPDRPALKVPRGRGSNGDIDYLSLTFRELEDEVEAWSARLLRARIKRGDRTLVMVRQGLPLIASAFALFKIGAVPVLIDPGMGLRSFLNCVERSRPHALIGIPLARYVSRIARRSFRSVTIRVGASSALTSRLTSAKGDSSNSAPPASAVTATNELAAILFTSGSTGKPKGVCYEHGMFAAQIQAIRETYGIEPGEIDLPMLPIFALFNPALGMTTIVPEIDPRRPASVDPAKIVQAIRQEHVTNSFGSPTLWQKIGRHCIATGTTLPSLRRVLCAGAAVPAALWESSRIWMPAGRLHSPYGATEALPVSTISSDEISRMHGLGACVGQPLREVEIKIIEPSDHSIPNLSDAVELPTGRVGEIIVSGPAVTKQYDAAPEATAAAKIIGLESQLWHRMGDCGYVDAHGMLWFSGRRVERVETADETMYTEPCEQVFRPHPAVTRCALIGLGPRGQQQPALVVETPLHSHRERESLAVELRALAASSHQTARIRRFFFRSRFPVDVRHNAKIHRLELARWAASARAYESAS